MATDKKATGRLVRMRNTARLSRPFRMVKMVAAQCPDRDTPTSHQPSGASNGNWIPFCEAEGHNPYISSKEIEVKKPEYTETPDGRKLKTGEIIEIELVETPNFEQVPYDIKAYSGRGLEAAIEMGWKYPEDLGYAPFCDFNGCWAQNPKFRTNVGTYCNRDQAALMVLVTGNDVRSDTGTPTYLTFGDDAANFVRQLNAVALDQEGRQSHVH